MCRRLAAHRLIVASLLAVTPLFVSSAPDAAQKVPWPSVGEDPSVTPVSGPISHGVGPGRRDRRSGRNTADSMVGHALAMACHRRALAVVVGRLSAAPPRRGILLQRYFEPAIIVFMFLAARHGDALKVLQSRLVWFYPLFTAVYALSRVIYFE